MSKENVQSSEETTQIPSVVSQELLNKSPSALTDKDIKYRERYKQKVQEFEQLSVKYESEKKELFVKASEAEKAKEILVKKVVDAKIENAAIAAGLADMDFVALLDKSKLTVKADGEVEGLKEAFEDLKVRKPHCFGSEKVERKTSSSTNHSLPSAGEETLKNAWDLSPQEFYRKTGLFVRNNR